jgi:hypothetical protein
LRRHERTFYAESAFARLTADRALNVYCRVLRGAKRLIFRFVNRANDYTRHDHLYKAADAYQHEFAGNGCVA